MSFTEQLGFILGGFMDICTAFTTSLMLGNDNACKILLEQGRGFALNVPQDAPQSLIEPTLMRELLWIALIWVVSSEIVIILVGVGIYSGIKAKQSN